MLKTQSLAMLRQEARVAHSIGLPRAPCQTSISIGCRAASSRLHLMAASLALHILQKDNRESG